MTVAERRTWRRLLFRDYLRSHPDEAQRYAMLKQNLAAQHSRDREAYTAAKSDYVDTVMAKASAELGAHEA